MVGWSLCKVENVHGAETITYQIQRKLKELGYDPGPIDGIWGKRTKLAMQLYQKKHGIHLTERPDGATLKSLGIDPKKMMAPEKENNVFSKDYKKCVSQIAAEIAKDYNFQAGWIKGTNKWHARIVHTRIKTLITSEGTPNEVFDLMDSLTGTTNYLQESHDRCDQYK